MIFIKDIRGRNYLLALVIVFGFTLAVPMRLYAYSANKVFMETLDDGRIRVAVFYTVPALKEFRNAQAIFTSKKEANAFYWHLVKGGDFSVNGPANLRFTPPKTQPTPW
ncbi:MAG: hypothetical protein H7249_15465 [Chitinophagaceae bacterium]|nr:hypothetical protein [Oligoflexus sp.]